MPLRIDIEDIYFITDLSWKGEIVHSTGKMRGSLTVEDYIHIYCHNHLEKIGSEIPIKQIRSLSLNILLFTIAKVNDSTTLHQASCVSMSLSVECVTIVFYWCTQLLTNMKNQLTSIYMGQINNFGYVTILCSFLFEKVPRLRSKVLSTIRNLRSWMGRWVDLMKQLGGGDFPRMAFDDEFLTWWDK